MEKAVLKKVVLENFMCYAHAEFDFYSITKIIAKNGVGKSTIATAYLWCLFNCDYELKDNPVVRREIDGVSVDDMDTSVELTLDVDGKEVTMKKVQKRTYSKDGSSYKDDNKYFINDVPKTLKDFNAYLDVDMNVFKMCSNVNAFLNQKPAEMREYLFGLVGDVTDLDIASQEAELAELVPLLNKYTVEELSAMNKATKTKITKDLPILDGQIKEKERDIQLKQAIEVSDLELQKNSLKVQIADCVAKQTDNDKLIAEYDKVSSDILNLKFELSDMSRKTNEDNIKARRGLESQINNLSYVIEDSKKSISNAENVVQFDKDKIAEYQKTLDDSRTEWKAGKERVFDENNLICPYCKQEYPEDKKEKLRADFKTHKEAELNRITDKGNTAKKMLDEIDKAKNEALTEAVNSHFGLAKWQLFEYAKNGNYKSCCIPTVDGKSILTTMSNKGNRILGRVDICNSIQKISGISAPIILDDSESLDEENQKKVAEMVDSQLIMLIVNDSEKLEIVEG